ncbi:MAG: Gfo/Idh/MocA family protein [Mycoplasmatales bacterium]
MNQPKAISRSTLTKLGFALVGYGGMGGHHIQAIQAHQIFDIRGIFDISDSANKRAHENGLNVYSSLNELIDDEHVQVVLVATPNDSHMPIATALMNAKKHVIVEKPAAMNLEELKMMIACANQNNVKFTINQNRRFDFDFLTARKIYQERQVGDVFHVESKVFGSRGIPGDWRGQKKHGGGMLFDWGIHLLDQMTLFTQAELTSLYCQFSHVSNEEVDDGFRVHLTYADGMTALVEVQTCNFIEVPRWYICGNNGSASIKLWEEVGKVVTLTSWDSKDVKPIRAGSGFTKTMAPRTGDINEVTRDVEFIFDDEKKIYYNFIDAIKNDAELIISHESLVKTFGLIENCFESALENKVIKF